MVINYCNFLADKLRLMKRLSFGKAFNYAGILAGFCCSRLTGSSHLWAAPFSVSAETAARCNLKCPECVAGTGQTLRGKALMELALFEDILHQHARRAFYCNLYFQGEPFLNPMLGQMICKAGGLGYYTCLSTNGHFLDEPRCREAIEAGLDRMIISLDGLTQESYSFYRRGGKLQKVTDGIRTLAEVRRSLGLRNPLIEVQFLVNRGNIHEVPALKSYCRQLGADMVTLKTMQVYGQEGARKYLPRQKKYNRYAVKKNKAAKRPCYRLWSHAVYTSDGLAVPCCYDKLPEFGMEQNKPGEYWNSPGMNGFRQKVTHDRSSINICRSCGE